MIINPYTFAAAPAPSQLINEQFEAPGATGWTSNTTSPNLAWNDQYTVLSTPTPPFFPVAPLLGSYSGRIQATATTPNRVNAQKTFTSSANVYCRFLLNHQRVSAGNSTFATIRDSSGNILVTAGLANASSLARASIAGGSTVNAITPPTLGTTYYAWFEYEKGTGTVNAICRFGYSTTSTRPTWPTTGTGSGFLAVTTNGGISTANADRIMFGTTAAATNYDVIIDDIQVQSTPFA